jgi:tetratricopeptide (TPR) repeat protein
VLRAHLHQSIRVLSIFFSFLTLTLFSCVSTPAKTGSQSLEGYLLQGRELEVRQDYAGAESVYREAAASFPRQPEVLKRLGLILQTELKFQESVDTFQRVLQQAPQYPEVNFYMGLSYLGMNEFEKAIDGFDRELAANPKYRRAHYYAAQAYQSLNRNTDALRRYDILLQQDPTDKKVLFQLIKLLKSATLTAITQLGNLDPDSEFMLVLKAQGYADEGKYADAIEKYKELLTKAPDFPGIHFALGEAYYNSIDYPNAEKELRLALREDPNLPMANYYLADILIKSQRMVEAIPPLEIVVSSSPQFMMGYFQLGKCYTAQGKLQEALALLTKAVELDPQEKMVHYQLAQLYARLNQPDKQQFHLEAFQKLNVEERDKRNKKKSHQMEKALQKQKEEGTQ